MKEHKKIKVLARISYEKVYELEPEDFIDDDISLEKLNEQDMLNMFKESVRNDASSFYETCDKNPKVEIIKIG